MVVVPTSHVVTLSYGLTPANWAGNVGSLVGLVGLVLVRKVVPPEPVRARRAGAAKPVGGLMTS